MRAKPKNHKRYARNTCVRDIMFELILTIKIDILQLFSSKLTNSLRELSKFIF